MSDPIHRITITLTICDEEPLEAEMYLLPDEDPSIAALHVVTGLLRLRSVEQRLHGGKP